MHSRSRRERYKAAVKQEITCSPSMDKSCTATAHMRLDANGWLEQPTRVASELMKPIEGRPGCRGTTRTLGRGPDLWKQTGSRASAKTNSRSRIGPGRYPGYTCVCTQTYYTILYLHSSINTSRGECLYLFFLWFIASTT